MRPRTGLSIFALTLVAAVYSAPGTAGVFAAPAAAPQASSAPQPPATPPSESGRNRSGRGNRGSGSGMPPGMDCEQMAAASRGAVTVESCKQMMAAQQAYDNALADPRASRPGDDKMTCDQIVAEIKQQPITAPDKAKVAEAQAAASDVQKTAAEQQKKLTAEAAADSAESLARAPERMFEPNAVAAREEQAREAKRKQEQEKMAAEMQPKAQRQMSSSADLMADIGKQAADNPRLAKLMQMANQKKCKVQ